MSEVFFCKLCERSWDTLPEGAIELTSNRGGHTYKVPEWHSPRNR